MFVCLNETVIFHIVVVLFRQVHEMCTYLHTICWKTGYFLHNSSKIITSMGQQSVRKFALATCQIRQYSTTFVQCRITNHRKWNRRQSHRSVHRVLWSTLLAPYLLWIPPHALLASPPLHSHSTVEEWNHYLESSKHCHCLLWILELAVDGPDINSSGALCAEIGRINWKFKLLTDVTVVEGWSQNCGDGVTCCNMAAQTSGSELVFFRRGR